MSDTTIDPPRVVYPETTIGTLMRDRDAARQNATMARAQAKIADELASTSETRAAALQAAIDSLGGDEPMIEEPLPPRSVVPEFGPDVVEVIDRDEDGGA